MNARCPACGRQSNDGHLCHRCTAELKRDLTELPWLWLETRHASLGLTKLTAHAGARSTEHPLPINLHTANWSRWAPQLPIQLRKRNVEVLSNDVSLRSEWG